MRGLPTIAQENHGLADNQERLLFEVLVGVNSWGCPRNSPVFRETGENGGKLWGSCQVKPLRPPKGGVGLPSPFGPRRPTNGTPCAQNFRCLRASQEGIARM